MKADVQYNDMVGTVAVDITDLGTTFNNLAEVTEHYGISQDEYEAVGIHFLWYDEESGKIEIDVILRVKKDDSLKKKTLELEPIEFYQFFKRIDMYLWNKHYDIPDMHIDDIERIE